MIRFLKWLQTYAAQAGLPDDFYIALVSGMLAYMIAHALRLVGEL